MQTASLFRPLMIALASVAFSVAVGAAENPRSGETLKVALGDAQALIAQRPNFQVVRVEGDSMLPFFGNGAVLVVKQMASEKLRAGMVVVYVNRFNETVAHRIVGRAVDGWEVQGYNNSQADSTRVNDANLVGVVYATFHSDNRAADPLMAAVASGAHVALAAPAR